MLTYLALVVVAILLLAGAFAAGYARRASVEPLREMLEKPAPPPPVTHTVQLTGSDGGITFVPVTRRTHRLFYQGRAWEHVGTTPVGQWEYRPTDADTPRQVLQKAYPGGR